MIIIYENDTKIAKKEVSIKESLYCAEGMASN